MILTEFTIIMSFLRPNFRGIRAIKACLTMTTSFIKEETTRELKSWRKFTFLDSMSIEEVTIIIEIGKIFLVNPIERKTIDLCILGY